MKTRKAKRAASACARLCFVLINVKRVKKNLGLSFGVGQSTGKKHRARKPRSTLLLAGKSKTETKT